MKSNLLPRELAALRRILHIVGQELITMAASEKLPDQWGELGLMSYTIEAQAAVYDQLVADKIIKERRIGK